MGDDDGLLYKYLYTPVMLHPLMRHYINNTVNYIKIIEVGLILTHLMRKLR